MNFFCPYFVINVYVCLAQKFAIWLNCCPVQIDVETLFIKPIEIIVWLFVLTDHCLFVQHSKLKYLYLSGLYKIPSQGKPDTIPLYPQTLCFHAQKND